MTVVFTTLLFGTAANATDYDFSGVFNQDNNVQHMNFTVGQNSNITVFSSSWVAGGFDPILAIWSNSGALLYQQDDGHNIGTTDSNGVAYAHGNWDSYYDLVLNPGSYIATVAEYNNFANGTTLAQGFMYDNQPHFTFTNGFGSQPDFNGVLNNQDARTGDWAFHLLNVESAIVVTPEPATMFLLGIGILGLWGVSRKKSKK